MNPTKIKGGTGIYLNANDKDAFEHFVSNSSVSYYKRGSNGLIYKLKLNPGVTSMYSSLDANDYTKPVNIILVKVTFICPLKTKFEVNNESINTTQQTNFFEEINIQTDVYLKTMSYLQPLCPAIVYANLFEPTDPKINSITSVLKTQIKNAGYNALEVLNANGVKLGLIGMEIMQNPIGLNNVFNNVDEYNYYFPQALQTLIEFVIKTGYTHGDFHSSNMLLNAHITDYYKGMNGCVKIIDFGYAQKLPKRIYDILKGYYENKMYVKFLNSLCDIRRKDNYDMNDYDDYLHTCLKKNPITKRELTNDEKYNMNEMIKNLFTLREQAIDDLVRNFTQKHLPLENSEKNKMYMGYIHEEKPVELHFNFDNQTIIKQDDFTNYVEKKLMENYRSLMMDMKSITPNYDYDYEMMIIIKSLYNYLLILNKINIGKEKEMYEKASVCYTNMSIIDFCVRIYRTQEDIDKFYKILLNCSFLQDVHTNTVYDYMKMKIPKKEKEFKIFVDIMKTQLPYENPEEAVKEYNRQVNDVLPMSELPFSMGGKKRNRKTKGKKQRSTRKNRFTCKMNKKQNKCKLMKGG
jgi:hypothetical protein